MFSYTFTDYLDDVSTIYISYPELLEKAGPLTAALANRIGEYYGRGPEVLPTGTARANADSKDYFGTITLRASMPVKITTNSLKSEDIIIRQLTILSSDWPIFTPV